MKIVKGVETLGKAIVSGEFLHLRLQASVLVQSLGVFQEEADGDRHRDGNDETQQDCSCRGLMSFSINLYSIEDTKLHLFIHSSRIVLYKTVVTYLRLYL